MQREEKKERKQSSPVQFSSIQSIKASWCEYFSSWQLIFSCELSHTNEGNSLQNTSHFLIIISVHFIFSILNCSLPHRYHTDCCMHMFLIQIHNTHTSLRYNRKFWRSNSSRSGNKNTISKKWEKRQKKMQIKFHVQISKCLFGFFVLRLCFFFSLLANANLQNVWFYQWWFFDE